MTNKTLDPSNNDSFSRIKSKVERVFSMLSNSPPITLKLDLPKVTPNKKAKIEISQMVFEYLKNLANKERTSKHIARNLKKQFPYLNRKYKVYQTKIVI